MIKIFLVGYGKMGQRIHQLSEKQGVEVTGMTSDENRKISEYDEFHHADGIIEFTKPDSAFSNVQEVLNYDKFIVSGTTGWEDQFKEIHEEVNRVKGRFFYASNFSIGANIMFELNKILAGWMNHQKSYMVDIHEIHHLQKLDKPSGTAKTIANGIIEMHSGYSGWSLEKDSKQNIHIDCLREKDVKGVHEVKYKNLIDQISIRHEAYSRDGFAIGALRAAIWLSKQKSGLYSMDDMLQLGK